MWWLFLLWFGFGLVLVWVVVCLLWRFRLGLTAVRLGFSWLGGLVILGITDSRCLYCDWFAVGLWLGVFLIIRPVWGGFVGFNNWWALQCLLAFG